MIISYEHRPAPIWILRAQQENLGTLSDVCGLSPKRKQRIARRLQCRLSGGQECGPTSARKLSPTKFR